MTYLLTLLERSYVNSMDGLTLSQKFNAYKGMTYRNIKVFFKDKMTVFFSILAPLIVFLLYILFLRDTYLSSMEHSLESVSSLINMNDVENIANGWLLSGILASSCVTVSLNSLTVMVDDKDRKVDYDYNSSPSNGPIVVLSYFTGALVNTLLITCGVLTVGLIVLSIGGSLYLTVSKVLLLYLVTILGCASGTLLMMVIASFFKKAGALGAFGGIVSAAIGFIIGAYVPLGNFSNGVQTALSFVPGSHVAAIYRDILIFESKLKLYEIEEILTGTSFFRCSKSMILHASKINYVSPAFNGRFEARLVNDERIIISRQYVPNLKKILGI